MEKYQELYEVVMERLSRLLAIPQPRYTTFTIKDRVREIVVTKLCTLIDISCDVNFKNNTFYFYSMFVGELLVKRLGYNSLGIAPSGLRFLSCNGKNLYTEVDNFFNNSAIDDAIKNSFFFLDEFKDEVYRLKLNRYSA